MFYTDGVVESRTHAPRRRHRLAAAQSPGTPCTAASPARRDRLIDQVDQGDDDRAVLILSRDPAVQPSVSPEAGRTDATSPTRR